MWSSFGVAVGVVLVSVKGTTWTPALGGRGARGIVTMLLGGVWMTPPPQLSLGVAAKAGSNIKLATTRE